MDNDNGYALAIGEGATLPRGYQWGAHVRGSLWYVIRPRHGTAIKVRTGTDDACLTPSELRYALPRAFDAVEAARKHNRALLLATFDDA